VQDATLRFTNEKPEERFRGHITLGRLKNAKRREIDAVARTVGGFSEELFGEWTATEIHIMRSVLSSEGAEHRRLAAAPLF
jgi:2'-5' RNA ligase